MTTSNQRQNGTRSLNVAVFLGLTALWALMTLWNFGLPGLYVDEVNHFAFIPGILSEEAAKLHHYRLYDNWLDYQDNVVRYPILGGSFYNTAIRPYLSLPFFQLAGYSVETLRLFSAALGLAAVLSASSLANRLFGTAPALLTGLIIILDANNAFSIRAQGGLFWMLVFFASMSGHFLVSASRRESPSAWLAAASGASIGLVVVCYFVGATIAAPLVVCGIVLFRKNFKHLLLFLLSGIVAYSPVVYAIVSVYLKTPGALGSYGVPKFAQKESAPFGSSENLAHVYNVLERALGNFDFARNVTTSGTPENWANLRMLALVLGILLLPFLTLVLRKSVNLRIDHPAFHLVFWTVFTGYIALLSLVKSVDIHHLIPLSMFIAMYIAAFSASSSALIRKIALSLCVVLVATGTMATYRAHSELARTGGAGLHNQVVSMPAVFFDTALADYHPVFVSWGFHLQYLFLTEGKRPYTFMGKPVPERIKKALRTYGRVGIIVSSADRSALIKEISLDDEIFFKSRDGKPIYSIGLVTAKESLAEGVSPFSPVRGKDEDALRTSPSPLSLCGVESAAVTVSWDFSNLQEADIQIWVIDGDKNRALWSAPTQRAGSEMTGPWARNGTTFEAIDVRTGSSLAKTTVSAVTDCP